MKTLFILLSQYDGRAIIPISDVCKDYFCHLTPEKFLWKVARGEIRLPVVRIEDSQKAARGVPVTDLALYIDQRMEEARRELTQLRR